MTSNRNDNIATAKDEEVFRTASCSTISTMCNDFDAAQRLVGSAGSWFA